MVTAQTIFSRLKLVLAITPLAAVMFLTQVTAAAAGGTQICRPGLDCTIGEFLYDDNYQPVATAACTLTTQQPGGGFLLSDEAMTYGTDGWYYHSFSTPASLGYYPTELCCTIGTEYMCIDKSFNVESINDINASDVSNAVWGADRTSYSSSGSFGEALQNVNQTSSAVANAVWGYSGRTLTSFGDLVTNVWNHNNRTLTSLVEQIDEIWNHESRSLTQAVEVKNSSTTTITTGTIGTTTVSVQSGDALLAEIKKTVIENRNLLEKLVNKPIIENFLEDTDDPDLKAKISQSKTLADDLLVDSQMFKVRIDGMVINWDGMSATEVEVELDELVALLGGEEDANRDTIYSQVNWLGASWDFGIVENLKTLAGSAQPELVAMQAAAKAGRKDEMSLRKLETTAEELAALVGSSADRADAESVFGSIRKVSELAAVLEETGAEVDALLARGGWSESESMVEVKELSREVAQLNQLSQVNSSFSLSGMGQLSSKVLKNAALAMRGVVAANMKLLALAPGDPFSATWLEEGSIVFKSVLTNPSKRISQTVPLQLYLPDELKEEDILETDPGLKVKYDAERDQLFVEGEYVLGPGESKTVAVRTEDIWVLGSEQLESLRRYVGELSRPLEKTAYFAQGVTLASDINMSLDRMVQLQASASTPEQKIKAFREAQLELASVLEKIEKLKDLVTQAGSAGVMAGFVGGAQAVAVWGLIIIMVVGFVFLAVYMRTLNGPLGQVKQKNKRRKQSKAAFYIEEILDHKPSWWSRMALPVGLVFVASAIALGSAWVTRRAMLETRTQEVRTEPVAEVKPLSRTPEPEIETVATGGVDVVTVRVAGDNSVAVLELPADEAKAVAWISETREVIRLTDRGGWVQIVVKDPGELGSAVTGWVPQTAVGGGLDRAEVKEDQKKLTTVTILETETGWLRVRNDPKGEEVSRVYPADQYVWLEKAGDWVKIQLEDGTLGWVASEYVRFN